MILDRPQLTPDERAFLAPDRNLLDEGYLLFDYVFETADDPLRAAIHLCREQSTALWARPGVDEDYRPRHAARVVDLRHLATNDVASTGAGGRFTRAFARIAHPLINFGPRLPNILTAACGEGAFFTPGVECIRLQDVAFPPQLLQHFEGPRFGVAGLRELLKASDRPLVTGVIKPNIGMDIAPFADIGGQALAGGADIVKDDEMLADAPYSPLHDRARAVLRQARRAAEETGEGKLYVANVTDEVDHILAHHEAIHAIDDRHAGLMLNALCVGLSACRMLARHTRLPLFSHFDFIAAFSRVPWHGVSDLVMTRFQRLLGFDAIIMPGLGDRMHEAPEQVKRNVAACLEPMGDLAPSLPIPGGSDWAGSLKPIHDTLGTRDFSIICGRGIFGHPDGPAAGARSVRDAWDAIASGRDPRHHDAPALMRAYEAFER